MRDEIENHHTKGVKFWVACEDCHTQSTFKPLETKCPSCESDWRSIRYDLESAKRAFSSNIAHRPNNLWRYLDLLPLQSVEPTFGFHAGGTPLLRAEQLGLLLGLDHLYIKDERQGPTNSFKDRQAAVSTAVLLEHELNQAVICSTGNVAIAFSATCARAGIQLWGFLTSLVPPEKMHEVAIYGTKVIKVTGTYDEAKKLAHDFADQRHLYLDRGIRSLAAVESMKTIAFEIAEQLPATRSGSSPTGWRSPDWYIQAVSGGLGPIGVMKGFQELQYLNLTAGVPSLGIIQAEGCAPMVSAWKAGKAQAEPVLHPQTHITTLTTGDPGRAYTLLQQQIRDTGGVMESVSDEEAFRALRLIAKLEGLSVEPAAAAAFAGLIKLAREGILKRDELIVVNCSGHAMPVKPQLLAPDWAQEIDTRRFSLPAQPQEGLLSALETLTSNIANDILIVDDQSDARRLIRRILESQGSYTIREAADGPTALEACESSPPDLVILDLMLPGMDGFEIMEKLKAKSDQTDIPVIVVTAKELTTDETNKLKATVRGLFVKGDFLGDDLANHVDKLLD